MGGIFDYINPFGKKAPFHGIQNQMKKFWMGTPEKRENVSLLREEQEPLYQQLVNAGLDEGAGGAFGTAADYYRNLLSDNPEDMQAFAAPAMRQFNQDIAPGISEQFAGMGSGGLTSSGFKNAQIQAGTDLAERLGAIRANLRQAGAAGLQNIGQLGLGNYSQNMVTQPGTEGFLGAVAPAVGNILSTAIGGPAAGVSNWFKGGGNKVGANTSPYGSGPQASPSVQSSSRSSIPRG